MVGLKALSVPGNGGWDWNSMLKYSCLLYTSDAADDLHCVDLGGRRIIKKKQKNGEDKVVASDSKERTAIYLLVRLQTRTDTNERSQE